MLKLVRIKRDNNIAVSIRSKEPGVNRIFLQSLAIAVGLHVVAIALFTVHRMMVEGEVIFSPSYVESDIGNIFQDAGVITQLDHEMNVSTSIAKPKLSRPGVPPHSNESFVRQMDFIEVPSFQNNPFKGIEEDYSHIASSSNSSSSAVVMHKQIGVDVQISGDIAEVAIVDDTIQLSGDQKKIVNQLQEPSKTVYTVQVEGKTGTIFWWDCKERIASSLLQRLAELYLTNLRFEPMEGVFIQTGAIEITFIPEGQS